MSLMSNKNILWFSNFCLNVLRMIIISGYCQLSDTSARYPLNPQLLLFIKYMFSVFIFAFILFIFILSCYTLFDTKSFVE